MTTKETVKALYDAFATGNIPFILESVSEDFTWQDPCDPSITPYGGTYKGRPGFGGLFQKLGDNTETTLWEVNGYVCEGDKVIALGRHGFQTNMPEKVLLLIG
jgi:ketosteroid isomerase-like protein